MILIPLNNFVLINAEVCEVSMITQLKMTITNCDSDHSFVAADTSKPFSALQKTAYGYDSTTTGNSYSAL